MGSKGFAFKWLIAVCVFLGLGGEALAFNPAAIGVARHVLWRAQHGNPVYRASVGDISVYYEDYGSGEPLLVLHGGTAFVESMHAQIRHLSSRFRVIAPDLRGHGRTTDGAGPLSYDLMADDIVQLMDQLGIPRARVVGHSDGGIIGLNMALRYPSRVQKLVMVSSNFQVKGLLPSSLAVIQSLHPSHPFVFSQSLAYRIMSPHPGLWPTLVDKIRHMWLTSPNFTKDQLATIKTPTLAMVGESDMVDPRHCEEFARSIPGAHFVEIPGGTHAIPTDRPYEVNGHMDWFL